jgi:hypothetical protein
MSLTVRPQLTFMVIFSIASLFLLVRFHTLDEQADWLRRRIGDPTAISALYLRGGTVFIIAAITASLALTAGASSAPLAGAWTDVAARVVDWASSSSATCRCLPMPRGPAHRSAYPRPIASTWNTGVAEQLRIDFPTKEDNPAVPGCRLLRQVPAARLDGDRRRPGHACCQRWTCSRGPADDVTTEGRRTLVATSHPDVRPARDLHARAPDEHQLTGPPPPDDRWRIPDRDRPQHQQ